MATVEDSARGRSRCTPRTARDEIRIVTSQRPPRCFPPLACPAVGDDAETRERVMGGLRRDISAFCRRVYVHTGRVASVRGTQIAPGRRNVATGHPRGWRSLFWAS